MGRQDDSPEHQDAQGEEVGARVLSGFRVETNANQDATSDQRGVLIHD